MVVVLRRRNKQQQQQQQQQQKYLDAITTELAPLQRSEPWLTVRAAAVEPGAVVTKTQTTQFRRLGPTGMAEVRVTSTVLFHMRYCFFVAIAA